MTNEKEKDGRGACTETPEDAILDVKRRLLMLDGGADVGVFGGSVSIGRLQQAANAVCGNGLWRGSKHSPYPLVRRAMIKILHDDGYPVWAISMIMGCNHSTVIYHIKTADFNLSGEIICKEELRIYNRLMEELGL